MVKFNWYKRDPIRAIKGMLKLSLEEKGAYNVLIDLIYINGGKVSDDERYLCGNMGCDPRVWRRIKQCLIDAKKIYEKDGFLHDFTADEITSYRSTTPLATPHVPPQPPCSQPPSLTPVLNENNNIRGTEKKKTREEKKVSKKERPESKKEEEGGGEGYFLTYPERELSQFKKQCPSLTDLEFRQELFKASVWVKAHGVGTTPDLTLSRWLQRAENSKPKKHKSNADALEQINRDRGIIL